MVNYTYTLYHHCDIFMEVTHYTNTAEIKILLHLTKPMKIHIVYIIFII